MNHLHIQKSGDFRNRYQKHRKTKTCARQCKVLSQIGMVARLSFQGFSKQSIGFLRAVRDQEPSSVGAVRIYPEDHYIFTSLHNLHHCIIFFFVIDPSILAGFVPWIAFAFASSFTGVRLAAFIGLALTLILFLPRALKKTYASMNLFGVIFFLLLALTSLALSEGDLQRLDGQKKRWCLYRKENINEK